MVQSENDRAVEFWSFIALGLKETAYIIYGISELDVSRYNYRDAVYYGDLYENQFI